MFTAGRQVRVSSSYTIVPMDMLASITGFGWPPNMSRYIARVVEMDVPSTPTSAFVYAKLCKLIVVGFIQMKYPQEWINTRVSMTEGVVKPEDRGLPTNFGLYIGDRARRMAEMYEQMSAKQKGKIWNTTMNKADRAANSDTFKAMQHDVAVFGRAAFAEDPERDDEN